MIKIAIAVIYLSIGMGVIAAETSRHPEIAGGDIPLLLVVTWPSIPIGRVYTAWFLEGDAVCELQP